jgi:hypothetical protein
MGKSEKERIEDFGRGHMDGWVDIRVWLDSHRDPRDQDYTEGYVHGIRGALRFHSQAHRSRNSARGNQTSTSVYPT